jgi:fluoride exporter
VVTSDPLEPDNVDPDVDLRHPPHFTGQGRSDTWRTVLVVAAGGGIGGLARLGVNTMVPNRGLGYPWATFGENVGGCLLIGLLMVAVTEFWPAEVYPRGHFVRPFLGTGVLGGFTTFSAYTSDTRALLAGGQAGTASLYLGATLGAGLVAVVAGMALARRTLSLRSSR